MDNLIGVIGLGYIGLPLLVSLSKYYGVIGFDTNSQRLEELKRGYDRTNELQSVDLELIKTLNITNNFTEVKHCDVLIITVPTPVTKDKIPDLGPINSAIQSIAPYIKVSTLVILESTVYPGITEEYCGRKLAEFSNKTLNRDFFIGYSPERANPGDREHRLDNITKIVSASNIQALERMVSIYGKICGGGLHKAPNIKVAEAAKVIENIQRDLNIALINELSIFMNSIEINIRDVLAAAETKWNFLKFEPGFVGGHCIGVDPYYLLHLSKQKGSTISLVENARRINDSMSNFCVDYVIEKINKNISQICLMGVTFKEDCPDIRNSMILDIYKKFKELNYKILINDPVADDSEVKQIFGCNLSDIREIQKADVLVFLVSHSSYSELKQIDINNFLAEKPNAMVIDMKNVLNKNIQSNKLIRF